MRRYSVDSDSAMPAPEAHREAPLAESAFRYALNEDAMAVEKLAEGIRAFSADTQRLEALIASVH